MPIQAKMLDFSISVETKKTDELSSKEIKVMNRCRELEFGSEERKDFLAECPDSVFFFLKQGNQILAFATLVPITVNLLGETYNIFGICNMISVEKGKGFGRMIAYDMIRYLEKSGKTGLGFCHPELSDFYKERGFDLEKGFVKRFKRKNLWTGETEGFEETPDWDGLHHEGSDNFIKKVLSSSAPVFIDVMFW